MLIGESTSIYIYIYTIYIYVLLQMLSFDWLLSSLYLLAIPENKAGSKTIQRQFVGFFELDKFLVYYAWIRYRS